MNCMTAGLVGWILYWPLGLFLSEQILANMQLGAIPEVKANQIKSINKSNSHTEQILANIQLGAIPEVKSNQIKSINKREG